MRGAIGHRAGHHRLPLTLDPPGGRALRGLPLGRGRGDQRVRPARDRAEPFLGRPDLQPRFHLGVPSGGHLPGQGLPVGGRRRLVLCGPGPGGLVPERAVRVRPGQRTSSGQGSGSGQRAGSGLGLGQGGLEPRDCGLAGLAGLVRLLDGGLEALRLVAGRPGRAGQAAEPSGDLRGRGVNFAERRLGLGHDLAGLLFGVHGQRQLLSGLLTAIFHRLQPGRRLVGHAAQGQLTGGPGRAA